MPRLFNLLVCIDNADDHTLYTSKYTAFISSVAALCINNYSYTL